MLSGGAACLDASLLGRSMARCELTFSSCSCAILTVAGRGMVVCIHNRGLAIYCLELSSSYASKAFFVICPCERFSRRGTGQAWVPK